jgi:hypothetical protein
MSDEAQETSPKHPGGRPSGYTQEIADRICARLVDGLSLRTICKADDMPSCQTVYTWLRSRPEFLDQYARAKEDAADAFAEEMLDIADEGTNDWMAANDPENLGYKLNGEHINRSRLRVDTRKWIASKLKPKKYGEKVQTELTGKDGGPIETADMTEVELARRIAFALQSGAQKSEPTEH